MALKKYGKKKFSKRRKTFKKKGMSDGKKALKAVRKISKVMHRERQFRYLNDVRVINSETLSKICLNNTERDTSESGRIGSDVQGIRIVLTYHFHMNSYPTTQDWWFRRMKLLIVRRKSSPDGGITDIELNQIYDTVKLSGTTADEYFTTPATDLCSGYLKYLTNFEVLVDRNLHLDNNHLFHRGRINIPFKHPVQYADLTALSDYIFKNSCIMMLIPLAPVYTTAAEGLPVFQWCTRFEYYE